MTWWQKEIILPSFHELIKQVRPVGTALYFQLLERLSRLEQARKFKACLSNLARSCLKNW